MNKYTSIQFALVVRKLISGGILWQIKLKRVGKQLVISQHLFSEFKVLHDFHNKLEWKEASKIKRNQFYITSKDIPSTRRL